MSEKRIQRPRYTSPRGVFVWPALSKPSYGSEDYPKPDGEYKVTLRLPANDAAGLRASLSEVLAEAEAEAEQKFAALPVAQRKKLGGITKAEVGQDEYDRDTEEPTGNVLIKFSMKASGESKKNGVPTGSRWTRKPALFDSQGHPITKPLDVWGGTEGKVSFEAVPYFVAATGVWGISLRLQAAQILVLREGGQQQDAGAFGFAAEAEEDGFDVNAYRADAGEGTEDAGQAGAAVEGGDF